LLLGDAVCVFLPSFRAFFDVLAKHVKTVIIIIISGEAKKATLTKKIGKKMNKIKCNAADNKQMYKWKN
jgi:hypothetical protein